MQRIAMECPVLKRSVLRYALAVHVAHDALHHESDARVVRKATARLRRIAPDQPMLPALDAKIARMRVIAALLRDAQSAANDLQTQTENDPSDDDPARN